MHFYIVDAKGLSQRQYERVQNELYSSLSAFRVSGEVVRITGARPVPQLVEQAILRGASEITAVGTESTFNELIAASAGKDAVLGFIPIAECELGNALGIRNIENGAKTIASRRVEELDLATVNGNLFFSRIGFGVLKQSGGVFGSLRNLFNLPSFEIKFSADGKYAATAHAVGGMIVNIRDNTGTESKVGNPTDGMLDILLLPKLTNLQILKYRNDILSGFYENVPGASLVHANKMEIATPANLPLMAGERIIAKTPAIIELIPKAIKVMWAGIESFKKNAFYTKKKHQPNIGVLSLEQVGGIEPPPRPWQGRVLPLNHTCLFSGASGQNRTDYASLFRAALYQ